MGAGNRILQGKRGRNQFDIKPDDMRGLRDNLQPRTTQQEGATAMNPYEEALALIKSHHDTSGGSSLAKCVLSLYNSGHAFSMGEILGPLDSRCSALVLQMVARYAEHGEEPALLEAGRWIYDNRPRLVELSNAMAEARDAVRRDWEQQRDEKMERLLHGHSTE